ncbi:glucosaminidase domain-containing protein [Aurantivibrio plasticivorans]
MSSSNNKANGLLALFVIYAFFCIGLVGYLAQNPIKSKQLATTEAPNFSAIKDISQRKSAFFNFIDPLIQERNQAILRKRSQLQFIADQLNEEGVLTHRLKTQLQALATKYRIDTEDLDPASLIKELDLRIGQIPPSMVLAQAANESAWGMSRFALKGNNYFGQWCYRKGCGLVPQQRSTGAAHEVAKFKDARASVTSYFLNINTHSAYKELRAIRKQLRSSQQAVTGLQLIEGLRRYSERGDAYVEELADMIRFNRLNTKDVRINDEYIAIKPD